MKNIFYFLAAFMTLVSLAACDKKLDLLPHQSLDEDVALNSDKNVKTVLNGAYDAIADDDFLGGNVMRNSELQGGDDEVVWVGTFSGPREIYVKEMTASNLDAQQMWISGYNTINIINNVLSAISVVNEADRGDVEGQARFLRALSYFELVRTFALPFDADVNNNQLGVPIVLDPTRELGEAQQVPRNSVGEVYQQILSDLQIAEEMLPDENEWKASKPAAAALLARVYLQMGQFALARDAADRVIGTGAYLLLGDYASEFGRDDNSAEDIFAIQISSQDGINSMNTFFSIPEFGGRDGDIEILQGHLDLYDPADARLALFFEGNGAIRSGKWNNIYGNISILRLAEMYLIRAECNARLGTSVGATAADDYNAVHTRAGLEAVSDVTVDDILLERRRELAHEGFKIHDMKRLKLNVGSRPYTDPKLVFPIPFRDIQANPNLEQNEGY